MNPTPRKHADIIKAWADGHQVEVHDGTRWTPAPMPVWHSEQEYRIKPPVLAFVMPTVIQGGKMKFFQPRTPELVNQPLGGDFAQAFNALFSDIFRCDDGPIEGRRFDLYIEIDTDGMKLAKAELVEHVAPPMPTPPEEVQAVRPIDERV